MKIQNAIKCDYCGEIKDADLEVFSAVLPTEDIFDTTLSFPSTTDLNRSKIHFCYDCYRNNVLIPAGNMADRKKDEKAYVKILRELAGIFRKTVFKKSLTK